MTVEYAPFGGHVRNAFHHGEHGGSRRGTLEMGRVGDQMLAHLGGGGQGALVVS